MPARTGRQYLEGLRNQEREVWLGGERVRDVTSHPGLSSGANAIASLYDMQCVPELREVMKREAQRQGTYEDYREACALSSRFSHASELDVVDMWERGVNEDGKPLTKFEVRALVERWCELFGCFPPSVASEPNSAAPAEAATDDLESRADDDLMTRKEVAEKLRAHVTTIQRMEQDGRLPKALRIPVRGRRHRVADVKALIESWDANRRSRD